MKATDVMMNVSSAGTAKAGASTKLSSGIRQATAAKSIQTKSDTNSFERTLDDAQASRAQSAKAEPKDTADKTAATADNKNVKDDVKDTPKDTAQDTAAKTDDAKPADDAAKAAAEEAASASVKDTSKSEGKGNAEKTGKDSKTNASAGMQEDTETVKATTLDAMLASLAGAAAAAGENAGDTAVLTETEAQPELTQTAMNLENLLPQTEVGAEQAAQNGKLMDMLNSMPQTTLKAAPELTALAQQALAAQQNTESDAQTAQPAVVIQPGTAAGLGDVINTAVNDTTQAAQPQQAFAQVLTQATAQPQVAPKVADTKDAKIQGTLEALFGTTQVTVEDSVALPNANNTAQQQLHDFLQKQGQQAQTTSEGGAELKQGVQLSENADFDVATRTEGNNLPQQPLAGAQNIMNPMMGMQTAAAVQQTAAQQPVQDTYHVMDQIVDQARLIRSSGDTEMVIQLNPKHLGELTLRVSVSAEGSVTASFHTDNPQVRGLIESSMVQLKQELQAQGIKVNNVEVYSGLSQDFFAGSEAGQQGFEQQGSQKAQTAALRTAAFEEDAEALSVTTEIQSVSKEGSPSVGTENGVDYKV